jgi:hypothetical protein
MIAPDGRKGKPFQGGKAARENAADCAAADGGRAKTAA